MQALPIKLPPYADEGGHGFLLRALSRNGLSFSRAAVWLKVPWGKNARESDFLKWSWAVGVDPDWLARRLLQTCRVDAQTVYGFLGHQWRGSQCFRIKNPQVCPRCIHERGYIPASWDLMGVSACVRHQEFLTDVCFHCKQLLVWNRPAIGICRCKRYLKKVASVDRPDEDLLRWTVWFSERAQDASLTSSTPLLPGLPRELSADGAFRVLLAFGLKSRPHEILPQTFWNRRLAPERMGHIVSRGYRRLATGLTGGEWGSFASVSHEPTLDRMEIMGVTQADRDLARRLKIEVFDTECQGDPARRPNGKGQLELFPGSPA